MCHVPFSGQEVKGQGYTQMVDIFAVGAGGILVDHWSTISSSIYYNIIVYSAATTLTELSQSLNSQKTPHSSSIRVRYGVSFMGIWEKIDCVITAPCCLCMWLALEGSRLSVIVRFHMALNIAIIPTWECPSPDYWLWDGWLHWCNEVMICWWVGGEDISWSNGLILEHHVSRPCFIYQYYGVDGLIMKGN